MIDENRTNHPGQLPEAVDDKTSSALAPVEAVRAPEIDDSPSSAVAHAQEIVPALEAVDAHQTEPQSLGLLPAPPTPATLALEPASDGLQMVAVPADGPAQ